MEEDRSGRDIPERPLTLTPERQYQTAYQTAESEKCSDAVENCAAANNRNCSGLERQIRDRRNQNGSPTEHGLELSGIHQPRR